MRHRIEIEPRAEGIGVHLRVDGHDIANQVTGYTVHHRSGGMPEIRVGMISGSLFKAQYAEATVEIEPDIAEILVKLGWTPPTVGDAA